MIGTIRKHSTWLWAIVIAAVIVSFVVYFAPGARNGGVQSSGASNLGSIAGKKIAPDDYVAMEHEVDLDFFFSTGQWPDKNSQLTPEELQKRIYVRLMLLQKANDLGIYVSDEEAAEAAAKFLRLLGRNGEAMPLDGFVKQVLEPENLSAVDFENFARHDLVIEQLEQAMGLIGELITPQEAAADYQREHQEVSAQIVFFSASNYLAQIAVTPQAVRQFYTNFLAEYRLPDRVQVNYVEFDLSNYLAAAQAELEKTNFNEIINENFRRVGPNYRGAKTADEAKTKIREDVIRQRAGISAAKDANAFAEIVFNQEPVKAGNLAAIAKQKGLTVHSTEPFSGESYPEEVGPLESFTKAAFDLTPDEPFAGPIAAPDAVYVIALEKQLPSEIPSFGQIQNRVTTDYRFREATMLAQRDGTNFVHNLTLQMATGKSFSAICAADGLRAENLPPFSISSAQLPDFENRAGLTQLKQAAFTTPPGKTSEFSETTDGGFVVYVKSLLPVDKAAMNSDLPKFTAELRQQNQREAFNNWLMLEANRELRDTPLAQQPSAPQR